MKSSVKKQQKPKAKKSFFFASSLKKGFPVIWNANPTRTVYRGGP